MKLFVYNHLSGPDGDEFRTSEDVARAIVAKDAREAEELFWLELADAIGDQRVRETFRSYLRQVVSEVKVYEIDDGMVIWPLAGPEFSPSLGLDIKEYWSKGELR